MIEGRSPHQGCPWRVSWKSPRPSIKCRWASPTASFLKAHYTTPVHKTNLTSQIQEGHTVGSAFCGQPQDRDGAVPRNWKMLSETLVRNVINTEAVLSVRVTEKAAEAESERPLLSGTQSMGKIHFTQSVMRACAGPVPSEGLGC